MCTVEKQVVVIGECLVRALNFFEQHSLAVSNESVYWENVVEAKSRKCLSAHTKDRTLDLLITNQMRYHYAIWALLFLQENPVSCFIIRIFLHFF